MYAMNGMWLLTMLACLVAILLLAGLAVALVYLSRNRTSGGAMSMANEATSEGRALQILKERYARGEISKEQYEEMRRDLVA